MKICKINSYMYYVIKMRGLSKAIHFRILYMLRADVKLTVIIQVCSSFQIIPSKLRPSNFSNRNTRHFSTDISQGISWETSSYEPLLKKLETVLINESIDEIWEAFSNYKKLHGFPDAPLMNEIIIKLSYSSEQHWLQKAYSLVLIILKGKPHLLYHESLTRLALTLARAQMPVLASIIMRVLLDKFKPPAIDTWNILFSHLVKSQIGSYLASEILIEICEYRLHQNLICKNSKQKMKIITPSSIMFNLVLNSCLHYESLLKAQQIIESMPQSGVAADANTIVIIAQIYELIGQRNELKKLQKHIDDVSSVLLKRHYHKFYDSLLSLHFKFNDFDAAAELVLGLYKQPKLRESNSLKQCMFQIGSCNLRTGSTILVHQNELQKDQVLDRYGLAELVHFTDGKLVPSAKAFAKLINGFVKAKNVNKISSLLIAIRKETELKELCLDVINSCVQLGWLETAHDIIDDLESAAIPVEANAYNTLLKAYKKTRMVGDFQILERQIKEAGHFVSLADDDDINQMSTLVEHIEKEAKNEGKPFPHVYEFNTSIQFFCKANMMDDAMRTFKRMQEMNVQPTVQTFSYLVNGYSSLQMYRQITILWGEIRRRLEGKTLVADRDLFDILLSNFLKGGYFERVMDVVNYMLKHNMFADKWKYKKEFLMLHKDLYRSLKTSEARTDAQSKRLQYVRAFRSWVGVHQKRYKEF